MPNGANFFHKQLRAELENYIKSQYFGKVPLLLTALNEHLDEEGLLYQKPFILKNDWKEIGEIKKSCLLKICGNKFIIRIVGDNGNVSFGNDENGFYLNTYSSNNLNPNIWLSNGKYETVNLLVFLDTTSIEIFINDGQEVFTTRVYGNLSNQNIEFLTKNKGVVAFYPLKGYTIIKND